MLSSTDTSRDVVTQVAQKKAALLSTVRTAHERLAAATATGRPSDIQGAQHRLQVAVDAARDADAAWGEIGDALGVARGNAYQRHRHRAARDPE
ncbi:hypothetical protein CIW49_02425 [Mycolicibacterium sp. P1-18]|uniref:hypothetical protein n=1 Tax=Mycolicibacterium sp. P1-18 TaxID=2024615 RepID=UPI0011F2CFFA|nr:hypothetical protein [Mycolicibacterium sp. P1-18]KAA0102198.1 hypothetical protein CIW49_02425 [Mycolicibacterium sp. P1-18]